MSNTGPQPRTAQQRGETEGVIVFTVLIVEDQQTSAEALARYVERTPGFQVIEHASNGVNALHRLATEKVDLVLLDIYLPDMSGLELLRRIRAAGDPVDVIAVTQARDLAVVQAVVAFGAMQYLVKPFTFPAVRQKLERYQAYRAQLARNNVLVAQQEIDNLLHTLRGSTPLALPKGISADSLHAVMSALCQSDHGMSAAEVAHSSGASRVTARRYLEYLVESGRAERSSRYQGAGRPEAEYRLRLRGRRGSQQSDPLT